MLSDFAKVIVPAVVTVVSAAVMFACGSPTSSAPAA